MSRLCGKLYEAVTPLWCGVDTGVKCFDRDRKQAANINVNLSEAITYDLR
jgi:hypothetical protein